MAQPLATFTPSSFGGGWIVPKGGAATRYLREYFGERDAPIAPLGGARGWIVEPQDVADVVTTARADGIAVELAL